MILLRGVLTKIASPLLMAIFASQENVMTASKISSARMTTSLPGTWASIISGERSMEKIRMASPASVLTKVTRNTITAKTTAKAYL